MTKIADARTYRAPDDLLQERVILVTGSTRGLGRAVATACASHGASVVVNGRDLPALEKLYDEITESGLPEPAILPLDLDTAGPREYDHAAGIIGKQLGRLDGIVHCASYLDKLSSLDTQRLDEWQRMLRVNVIAPFALDQACARLLRSSPDASVVFTSETHASAPAAYWGGYAVSKSALETLARIQADEWSSEHNLRANIVVPGPISSPLRGRTHPGESRNSLTSPEDITSLYLYLLGPDSRDVSGQVLRYQR